MRAIAAAAAAVVVSLAAPAAAHPAESSIRCAGGIVSVGDATVDLLGKCGEPALREPRGEETWVSVRDASGSAKRRYVVTTERWSYDFGPRQFLMFVTLEGGKVVAVERGGYGYVPAEPVAAPVRRATCEPSALHVGDAKIDLLARCGQPAVVDVRPQVDVIAVRVGTATGGADGNGAVTVGTATPTELEVWTYDFGPSTFVRFVVLENGVVARVETGGHGYAR